MKVEKIATASAVLRTCRRLLCSLSLLVAFVALDATRVAAQGGGNPCDSLIVTAQGRGNCCYNFTLTSMQSVYAITDVRANVLAGSGTVISGIGPYTTTTTSTSINWDFPNTLPVLSTSGLLGCFNSNSGTITVEFVWIINQDIVVCRDTLRLDCVIPPPHDSCEIDTLILNTGWNHLTNSLDPPGTLSNFWKVIVDPTDGPVSRAANIIAPYFDLVNLDYWAGPLPISQWISTISMADHPVNGIYTFQACFCLDSNPGTVKIKGALYTDDEARIYINNDPNEIAYAYHTSTFAFHTPATQIPPTKEDITLKVKPGRNCIKVVLENNQFVAMGFNLAAYITTSNPGGLVKDTCCSPFGSVTGTKFWDKDCDRKYDAGEPGLAGWTIKITDGTSTYSTTTDYLGNYSFINLSPGNYTVSEIPQISWTQSYPAGSTYAVALTAGQVVANRDFGNCRDKLDSGCFETRRGSISCDTSAAGRIFKYRFDMRSFRDSCSQQTASVSVLSPSNVFVSPSSFPVSSAWESENVTFSGSGAVEGATVMLVVRVCCFKQGAPEECCTDTIQVTIPKCPDDSLCFEIVESKIYCKEGANGTQLYEWCFKVKNLSDCKATYFEINPPLGVNFTPSTVVFGSLAPNATSGTYCMQISGSGAVPGPLTVGVTMCDQTKRCCCTGWHTIKLPECPKKECCDGFSKAFSTLGNSASKTGTASLGGYLAAVGTGGSAIIKVDATLANATINGQPVYGYFVNGKIYSPAPFGTTLAAPGTFGRELIWPTVSSGYAMGAPHQFRLKLRFPPMASGIKSDVVRYCVRFRYTDANCVTCDTLMCIARKRYKFIIFDERLGLANQEKENSLQGAGQGASITGSLEKGDSGAIQIVFPPLPAELGSGRYVGLSIIPVTVPLDAVSSSIPGVVFLTANGIATSEFNLQPTTGLNLGLRYRDLGNRSSLRHTLVFRYVLDSDRLDTLEEEVEVTLRRGGLTGGDLLAADSSDLRNVKTYALHLTNANGSLERIDRVVINTRGNVTIVAVGPTSDDTTVAIGFRQKGEHQAAVETSGERIDVAAGLSQKPIYLTLAGIEGKSTTVRFFTLNGNGEIISEGELVLDSPLHSLAVPVGDDDPTVTGAMLYQSYPNPSTQSTTIGFQLATPQSVVTLTISDVTGRVIATPINGESLTSGEHAVYLNTSTLPSGSYFYTLRTGSHVETRSMEVQR